MTPKYSVYRILEIQTDLVNKTADALKSWEDKKACPTLHRTQIQSEVEWEGSNITFTLGGRISEAASI